MNIAEDKQVKGQSVCIVGHGTAGGLHKHTTIKHTTTTLIVLEGGFRIRKSTGNIVGAGEYAWYETGTSCQAKKGKSSAGGE